MDAVNFKDRGVRMRLLLMLIGCWMALLPAIGLCSPYYSVSVATPMNVITESAWYSDVAIPAWAPQTVAQIAAHGIMMPLPSQELVAGTAWEMDLGVLHSDENILHLLGTAIVSDVTTPPQRPIATISAVLVGTQNADCRASLLARVDVTSQQLLVEKLHFVCLGNDVRVATAALPKE